MVRDHRPPYSGTGPSSIGDSGRQSLPCVVTSQNTRESPGRLNASPGGITVTLMTGPASRATR
jgi:hypothetical protein